MSEATRIPELFGSLVFNERTMEQYVPQSAMDVWRGCLKSGQPLPLSAANEIADAMKTWALEHGATHFTHWFQPLSGVTAEKHDSFINNAGGGRVMMDFSGKELVRGEPDASSFPNGGLRATFEARGYSAWDPTAFAFIKDGSLCIPTVFCSYSGDALDKKTPLLRSIAAVDRAAVRVLKLFGDDAEKVTPQIGAEQEYFLIDRELYLKRMDLRLCGRALFGAKPPKGQELDDHYFGAFRPRVAAYMKELDEELWKLGVLSKTKHNEVAPGQHEMAPIYTDANTASDQNQLVMETMKKVAERHNLVCLLHEKPFAGVNGSGKHVTAPEHKSLRIGVDVLPAIPQDTTDRNRTSPVAFTGNKFEFRMPGSSQSIAGPVTILNTIMAEELDEFYAQLKDAPDFTAALHKLIRDTFSAHRRIIFNGNGYEEAWIKEAEKRGLANLHNTAEALPTYILPKNIELLTRQGVYSKEEIFSRHEVHIEKYCKVIRIEAATLVDMVQHGILNAASEYEAALCNTIAAKRAAAPELTCHVESSLANAIGSLNEQLLEETIGLKTALETVSDDAEPETLLHYYHDEVEKRTNDVRKTVDKLEVLTASKYWPYPTFCELLFSV